MQNKVNEARKRTTKTKETDEGITKFIEQKSLSLQESELEIRVSENRLCMKGNDAL